MKRIITVLLLTMTLLSCQKGIKPIVQTNHLEKLQNKTELINYLKSIGELDKSRSKKQRWPKIEHSTEELLPEEGMIVVTGSRITAADLPSITNNQVQGVDEGDIVKAFQNFLIILRNGKLYSVDIGLTSGHFLQPIDSINAYHPNWVHDVWLDEMLIKDNLILITGFNYDEDLTEIIRFKINEEGKFSYVDTHLIDSEDYFSESNYASRLIENQLVTYFPGELIYNSNYEFEFPKISKLPDGFKGDYQSLDWENLIGIENIYHPTQTVLRPYLHTIIKCDIAEPEISCDAVGLISNDHTERFVTTEHIYLTTSAWSHNFLHSNISFNEFDSINDPGMTDHLDDYEGKIFRINLQHMTVDQSDIDIVPMNQFSFHQVGDVLYVAGQNDDLELVKIPSHYFDSQANIEAEVITSTVIPNALLYRNKFIGNRFVVAHGDVDETESTLVEIIDILDGSKQQMTLEYTVERIEIVGGNLFTAGYNSLTDDDRFSGLYVGLFSPENVSIINENFIEDIVEGETRSHAFNTRKNGENRIIGFTSKPAIPEKYGEEYYYNEPSEVTFVGGQPNELSLFGHVKRHTEDDETSCEVSCDDWYGNTRPIFIGDRLFALSGFELIEVSIRDGLMQEVDRVVFNQFFQR